MNARLSERVVKLEDQAAINENDLEVIKQYLRRDLLEIHGVPVTQDENSNAKILSKMLPRLLIPTWS